MFVNLCCQGEEFRLEIEKHASLGVMVSSIRQLLDDRIVLDMELFLYHGGAVLTDFPRTISMDELCIVEGSKVWAFAPCQHVDVAPRSLSSVFPLLKGSQPASEQDDPVATGYTQLFSTFLESLRTKSAAWTWQPEPSDMKALGVAAAALDTKYPELNGPPCITWYPQYGAALLADMKCVDEVNLRVIGLDRWDFSIHSGLGSRTHSSQPVGCSPKLLFVGTVDVDSYDKFCVRAKKYMQKAMSRTGDKRSAAKNPQGNSKTPALVHAVLGDALADVDHELNDEGSTPPKGGFTDVGLHTGGLARNTSWPLVEAVLQHSLEANGHQMLFVVAMVQLKLWCAERKWAREGVVAADPVLQMLEAVVVEGATLADQSKMAVFAARCTLLRSQVERAVRDRSDALASTSMLPVCENPADESYRSFNLSLPELVPPTLSSGNRLVAARKQAQANLNWLPEPLANSSSSWGSLSLWLNHSRLEELQTNLATMVLVLDTVEKFVFLQAATLESFNTAKTKAIDVEQVVVKYHVVVELFRTTKDINAVLSVEIYSREVLVVWVCFCMAHGITAHADHLLKEYSVAPDWRDLRHLVLPDKLSVDAALHVAAYLRANCDCGPPVFSGRCGDATIAFSLCHAQADPTMLAAWKHESELAAQVEAVRWEEVRRKKALLVTLDEELRQLKSSLLSSQSELDKQEIPYRYSKKISSSSSSDTSYYKALSDRDTCKRQVSAKEVDIKFTESVPSPVRQPLPVDVRLAMPLLFFILMPENYQILSRLSFTAQQVLLPRGATVAHPVAVEGVSYDIAKCVESPAPITVWRNYYMTDSDTRRYTAVSTAVILGSNKPVISAGTGWYSQNVRDCKTSRDGVWYPDSLSPALYWTGGDWAGGFKGYFNPFKGVPEAATVSKFTQQLLLSERGLQWAMEQHGRSVSQSRGNWPEAVLQDKSLWLPEKSQYLCFGTLRAVPNQQMRQLCAVLHERKLPLGCSAVRRLFQMVMFQIGDISDEDRPVATLRTDMDETDGWDTLRGELDALAEVLRDKPGDHATVLLLGELAAVASQWDPLSRATARDFAHIARDWADSVRIEVEKAPPEEVAALQARCSLFCMYSIVCQSAGDLSSTDVDEVVQAAVLAEHNRLFGSESSEMIEQVRTLTAVAQTVLTRRLPFVLAEMDRRPASITTAVKLVLDGTPDNLAWQRVCYTHGLEKQRMQCYEAVSDDGHLYSINVQTGVILFDGCPPRRLPSSILSIPLYQRSFGADTNFEVVISAGVMSTTRLVLGRRYIFYSNGTAFGASTHLTVLEVNEETGAEWELLGDVESWADDLPVRLKSMHSYWVCRKQGQIALRGHLFKDRDFSFLLINRNNGASCSGDKTGFRQWKCIQIPDHLKKVCESGPIDLWRLDCLVVPTSALLLTVLQILKKFESREFIHLLVTNSDRFAFEIPRFNLRFELCKNGVLQSQNYNGFVLRRQQQLLNTLYGFRQYLVLISHSRSGNCLKLLVPTGTVSQSRTEFLATGVVNVSVLGCASCHAKRRLHVYQVHQRFGNLEVSAGPHAVEARLQLAALYAATDAGTREPSGCTGGEVAVGLLRQSWVNRPLTVGEMNHLDCVDAFGYRTPALSLLCNELLLSSRELVFLFPEKDPGAVLQRGCNDAKADYVQRKQAGLLNARSCLNSDEETRVLGTRIEVQEFGHARGSLAGYAGSGRKRSRDCEAKPANSGILCPSVASRATCEDVIASTEANLRLMIEQKTVGRIGTANMLPLVGANVNQTAIERSLVEKLHESSSAWEAMKLVVLIETPETLLRPLIFLRTHLESTRKRLETELISAVSHVPDGTSLYAPTFFMHRAANFVPVVTRFDLVRAAWAPEQLLQFNLFLSASALLSLQQDILVWLQACVVEDKLCRMMDLAHAGNTQELERELQEIGRKWNVRQHPQWLVFEVQQRLQIRHVQYAVAQELIHTPGAIVQLNMGEGKTRVILPLLVLSLSVGSGSGKSLPRLHFLSALMGEAYEYLHWALTASPLCRRVCLLPFHRDVQVSARNVRAMRSSITRYAAVGGAVCVSREDRLSLNLKAHELNDKPAFAAVSAELRTLESLPYFDILDESDELLRHTYQLTYAMGSCCNLPSGPQRWWAAAALLIQLMTNTVARGLVAIPDVSVPAGASRGAGVFGCLRLIPGPVLELHGDDIRRALIRGVIAAPPHNMRWMKQHSMGEIFVNFVSDPTLHLDWFKEQLGAAYISPERVEQLLAFRGLLACGLLTHCLCRRYRVDYGISDRRSMDRRVAVPFRASDTPSERAEYSQPDTLIVLTLLSYFHRGLTVAEIKEACSVLHALGEEAKKFRYALWFESARGTMTPKQLEALATVGQLDITNASSVKQVHEAYSFNMAAIEFWLECCVFPVETMQFPHKISANAFNLTDNTQVAGFSGTKDNYLLLPLNVELTNPSEDSTMIATDGKMADLVFLRNERVECLAPTDQLSADILQLAVSSGAVALIDAGATMAGLSNDEVAAKLLKLLPASTDSQSSIKGVVYFNTRKDAWFVINHDSCRWPLGNSPIHESEAFVYFDESRCRGADMKMLGSATALVTVGPDMCKDKIMQAAGRMRKLMLGQKLIFAVPAELVSKVRAAVNHLGGAEPLRPSHLLEWVVRNTVRATEDGLPEWASQGSHFNCTRDPSMRRHDECYELKDMYGGPIMERTVMEEIERRQEKDLARIIEKQPDDPLVKSMREEISMRGETYGSDVMVVLSGVEEECERELENEREKEREEELVLPRQEPLEETLWEYSKLLVASSPPALPVEAGVMPLQDVFTSLEDSLSSIKWEKCGIFVTANFFNTVQIREGVANTDLSEYLRPVQAVVQFPSGECLLLSELEADSVLELMWESHTRRSVSLHPTMCSLCYLRDAACADEKQNITSRTSRMTCSSEQRCPQLLVPVTCPPHTTSPHLLAGLCLFAGETMFPGPLCAALIELLPTAAARKSALRLPVWRGRSHMISHSDLEEICSTSC